MSAFDLLQGWLKPLLDPLNEVQSVIQQPMSLHQENVSEFSSLVEGLYQGPNAFEGQAADAVKAMTESYLQMEASFSGAAGTIATGTSAAGGVLTLPTTAVADTTLTEAATVSIECGVEITAAAATAAGEMGADAGLDAVTSAIDVAAVAQAGLDPVTDIPAAVITAIDMGTKIAILVALGWSIFNAVLRWINDMNRLGHVTWPPLPSFLDPGVYNSGFTNQGGLTSEEKLAEELFKEFENTGITLDEISEMISKNPGLSKDQYRLLIEYYRRYSTMPYGVKSVIGVGTNKKGKAAKIFYVTQGDIKHVRGGHIEFDTLTDGELVALIEELLQQQPDAVKSTKDSDKYEYDDVEIDGKYYTIGIAISKNNLGRIVTTFVTRDQ